MRKCLIAACLLVGLAACSNTDPKPDDATAYLPRDIFYVGGQRCEASLWITGVIVKPSGIQDDDNGVVYGLMWGLSNTAHVEYGKRYKIGGTWFGNPGGTFWACAGAEAVIPQ
jgi:hypothetical protein